MAAALAEITEKFSGADLRSVVKQARTRAEHIGTDLSIDILIAEVEKKRLRATAIYDEFQKLRDWALINCEMAGPTA